MRDSIVLAGQWQLRGSRRIQGRAAGFCHVHPHVAVALLAGIVGCMNLVGPDAGIGSKRRNVSTGAGMDVELPAVIAALKILSFHPAAGERNSAMRTNVLHGESSTIGIASKDDRLAEKHRLD